MFNGKRLTLARKRRGVKIIDIARSVGKTERSISAYEKGEYEPEQSVVSSLSRALGFPREFFFGDDPAEIRPKMASFRALTKMTASQRDKALSSGQIALMLSEWIEKKYKLPEIDIPDLTEDLLHDGDSGWANRPEMAAELVRVQWGLGERPIKDMISLLESKGVRVFSLAINAREIDAFSIWINEKPFVFLNTQKSAERCRFDAAHELGHLVLHKREIQRDIQERPKCEQEANAFSSAFLMPRESVFASAPKAQTLKSLIFRKKQWGVSVAALNHRFHSLSITSDWIYRKLCIQIRKKGYSVSEPEEMPREKSLILLNVFSSLWKKRITKSDVANELHLATGDINEITFDLMLDKASADTPAETSGDVGVVQLRLID